MQLINSRSKIEEYLSSSNLSRYFSFDIKPYVRLFQFDSLDYIMGEGSSPDYLYYMVEGHAKLYLTHSNGKVSLINFLKAPCFLGEMELIGSQEESNGVQAITSAICLALPVGECKNMLLSDAIFLRELCIFLSTKAIGNTATYTKNQAFPLENRLADFILTTSHNNIYSEKHTEVSEYLGVTYRHLLYVLAGLVEKGILKKNTSGYKINDINALKSLANS